MRFLVRAVFLTVIAMGCVLGWWLWESREKWLDRVLPFEVPTERLVFHELVPPSTSVLLDRNGKVLEYLSPPPLRLYRPLTKIHPDLAELVVFMEDAKFFFHKGFDKDEILNSLEENLKEGRVRRGGSTLTQQLAKNLFLSKERTWTRKAFEVPWTLRLERDFTKRQILELYLNTIEWGPEIRGAEAAAQYYFDRSAADLELGQSMALALIVPNPIQMNLHRGERLKEQLRQRRMTMIQRLRSDKRLNDSEIQVYESTDWSVVPKDAPQRQFPILQKSSAVARLLAPELQRRKQRQLKSSLDKDMMRKMNSIPSLQIPKQGARWVLWREGSETGPIRAVRRLESLEALQPGQTPEGFFAQELREVSARSLIE
jgi:monofunctional biosynthetic peptidoglycan transglycosylase